MNKKYKKAIAIFAGVLGGWLIWAIIYFCFLRFYPAISFVNVGNISLTILYAIVIVVSPSIKGNNE